MSYNGRESGTINGKEIPLGQYVETADYVIFKENGIIKAKNGKDGSITFSGTDASTVIQNAIDSLSRGGLIFFKVGDYELTSTIIIKYPSIYLIGEATGRVDTSNGTRIFPNTDVFPAGDPLIKLEGTDTYNFARIAHLALLGAYKHSSGIEASSTSLFKDVMIDHCHIRLCKNGVYGELNNIWIQNNWIEQCERGIDLSSSTLWIQGNLFWSNTVSIWVSSTYKSIKISNSTSREDSKFILIEQTADITRLTISKNHIRDNNGYAIGIGKGTVSECSISKNILDGGGTTKQFLMTAGGGTFQRFLIEGNIIRNTLNEGMALESIKNANIINNKFYSCGSDGIELENDCDGNLIALNYYENNGGYGINISNSNCANNLVKNSYFSGNSSGAVNDAGTDTLIKGNKGYVTENQGTSTQNGDGTTVTFTIAHGLEKTPTVANVWAESADANGDFYVSGKDGTNIEITYASAPAGGTDNLTWGFEAKVQA